MERKAEMGSGVNRSVPRSLLAFDKRRINILNPGFDETTIDRRPLALDSPHHRKNRRVIDKIQRLDPANIAAVATPNIPSQHIHSLPGRLVSVLCDIHRIQMHITTKLKDVLIRIYQSSTEPSLHQVAALLMVPIKIDRVSRLEAMHETAQIPPWRL